MSSKAFLPHIKKAQVRHMSAFVSQTVTLSSVFCSLTMLALQKGHADQTRFSRLRNAADVMLWPMSLLSEKMTSPSSLPEYREVQLYGQCNMCMKRQRHTQDSNCSSQAVATAQYSAGLHPVCYLLQHPQQAVSQAITQAVQIGMCMILLVVLLLVTRKEKLLSMVFTVNLPG